MIEVLHGEAQDLLPNMADGSFDVIFADPPWGVAHFDRGRPFYASGGESGFDFHLKDRDQQATFATYLWLIEESGRLLNPFGSFYLMAGSNLIAEVLAALVKAGWRFRLCAWAKPNSPPARPGIPYRSAVETVIHAYRKVDIKRRYSPSAYNYIETMRVSGNQRVHTTQKPVKVVQHFLSATPGRVLDPFCGSGPTLVAAQRLGLDAVGVDNDIANVKITEHRLATDAEIGYY